MSWSILFSRSDIADYCARLQNVSCVISQLSFSDVFQLPLHSMKCVNNIFIITRLPVTRLSASVKCLSVPLQAFLQRIPVLPHLRKSKFQIPPLLPPRMRISLKQPNDLLVGMLLLFASSPFFHLVLIRMYVNVYMYCFVLILLC